MNKNTLIITTLSIFGMLLFLVASYFLTSKTDSVAFSSLKSVKSTDYLKWSAEKKLLLVEYSDYQCPACQYVHFVMKDLEKDSEFLKIKNKVTLVYRHFPLDQIHKNARAAAYAAEAAGYQGKFFEMSDVLFTKQSEWGEVNNPDKLFVSYAKSLKIDTGKFTKDLKSKNVKDKVQNDFISGNEVQVQGTPSFFLDGKLITTPQTVEDWKKLLLNNN